LGARAAFGSMLCMLAATGCGSHTLEVALSFSSTCAVSVPSGGSVLYELSVDETADAGGGFVCGSCLAVPSALTGGDALVAYVRAHAPTCSGINPGAALQVRVTAWTMASCQTGNTAAPILCSSSTALAAPDGHSDAQLATA
jgi:hypothetical protein